jgi:hypothetical protein
MATIEARHYGTARTVLQNDPIVQSMAHGLKDVPLTELTHDDGTPRFEFMQAANAQYDKRGGTNKAHIGAVAEALLFLVGAAETPADEFARLMALPITEQARPTTARRIRKLANMPENTAAVNAKEGTMTTTTATATTTTAPKTSRYNAEYAKAYRDRKTALRIDAEFELFNVYELDGDELEFDIDFDDDDTTI